MKTLSALLVGLCFGYVVANLTMLWVREASVPGLHFFTFFAAWTLMTWLLLRSGRTAARVWQIGSALLVGLFSGHFLRFLVFIGWEEGPGPQFYGMLFFTGGWALTTFLVLRGAKTIAQIWVRGSLVGAAQWNLAGIVVTTYRLYNSKVLDDRAVVLAVRESSLAMPMILGSLMIYVVAAARMSKQPSQKQPRC